MPRKITVKIDTKRIPKSWKSAYLSTSRGEENEQELVNEGKGNIKVSQP